MCAHPVGLAILQHPPVIKVLMNPGMCDEERGTMSTGDMMEEEANSTVFASDRAMVALSRRILVAHYEERDIDAMMRLMADDLTWIGPLDFQSARSAAEMRALVEPEYGTRIQIIDEHWGVRRVAGACVVIARYGAIVSGTGREDTEFRQSATFMWALTPDGPRIVHLHMSNSYDVPPRGERLSVPGEDGVGYVMESLVSVDEVDFKRISFNLALGGVRYLAEDSILCLDASEEGCIVVHDDGSFTEQDRLAKVEERMPSRFVRTHRRHIVNSSRVTGVHRFAVELDDGSERPIAERRYIDIVEALEHAAARSLRRS